MTTMTYTGTLVVTSCPVCGVMHAIPTGLRDQAKRHGTNVYCPLGHSWKYMKTVEQDLAEAKRDADYYRGRLTVERKDHEHTQAQLRGTKGALTRTKKRVAAGVCPCCHRTFQALGRHMSSQHPEYASEEER